MYNRFCKKSILFFLVGLLASVAVFSFSAEAASITTAPTLGENLSSGLSAILYDSYDDGTGVVIASYSLTFPLRLAFTYNDTYINGIFYYNFSISSDGLSNGTIHSVNMGFEDLCPYQGMSASLYRTSISAVGTSARILVICDNVFSRGTSIGIGNMTYNFSVRYSGGIAPAQTLGFTFAVDSSGAIASNSPDPVDNGLEAVIKQAILDAFEDRSLLHDVSVADYLNYYLQYLYNTMSDVGAIRTAFNTFTQTLLNDWLGVIIDNQDDVEYLMSAIKSSIDTFYSVSAANDVTIIRALSDIQDKLYQILHNGEQVTEGQSEAEFAASQLQSQVDYLANQPTLDIDDVLGPIGTDAAVNGDAAADIYFWSWDSHFVTILSMCMALGLVGFIVYGKSG